MWEFADLRATYFLRLQICDLRTQLIFCCHSNLRCLYGWFTWNLGLKYSYVGRENTSEANHSRSESETFRLCKFVELRFADWDTKEICGFAICGLIITNLRTCTSPKFADLPLPNEPKHLRISELLTNKKNCLPTWSFFRATLHRNKHPICMYLSRVAFRQR